jgi:hypothetical protein
MSIRWVVPGCGMQLRLPGGTQGKSESNSAAGRRFPRLLRRWRGWLRCWLT